jgi:hypothetical protein
MWEKLAMARTASQQAGRAVLRAKRREALPIHAASFSACSAPRCERLVGAKASALLPALTAAAAASPAHSRSTSGLGRARRV